MKLKIYPILYSEIRKGTVWSFHETKSDLIKIINLENKKSIVVSHRKIDDNFIKIYNLSHFTNNLDIKNSDIILIDEYYRKKLFLLKYNEVEILIKPVKSYQFWLRLSFLKNHSDEVVKITFWFTLSIFIFTIFTYIVSFDELKRSILSLFSAFLLFMNLIFI